MKSILSLLLIFVCLFSCKPKEKEVETTPQPTEETMKVNPNNYIRAETDKTFAYYQKLAPINEFFHYRKPTPLDNQGVVRMNRDCLYSGAVIDTKGGATLTIPEMFDDRYVSVMLTDNDMYVPEIYHKPGVYDLPQDTRYLFAVIRVQVKDPSDAEEVVKVNQLQDQFLIKANSFEPFEMPNWDMESLGKLHDEYNAKFAGYDMYPDEWAGKRGEVNDDTRRLAVAGAWGLFPNHEAVYINYDGSQKSADKCWEATYTIPENNAFWSITMYGKDGKMQSENCLLNGFNVKMNDDGKTFTVHYGTDENCKGAKNRIDISEGWNFLMRVYRPGESVLKQEYKLPDVKEVQ